VTEANIDVSSSGFQLQAMDTSHVSLIAMHLRSDAFEHFRCDRAMSMGELAQLQADQSASPDLGGEALKFKMRPCSAAEVALIILAACFVNPCCKLMVGWQQQNCTMRCELLQCCMHANRTADLIKVLTPIPCIPQHVRHEPGQPGKGAQVRRQRRHRDA
jgi:hypothetical protein